VRNLVDWDKVKEQYELLERITEGGSGGSMGFKFDDEHSMKIYSMGEKNPVIRIDIKRTKR
jgi:hypothetical protein